RLEPRFLWQAHVVGHLEEPTEQLVRRLVRAARLGQPLAGRVAPDLLRGAPEIEPARPWTMAEGRNGEQDRPRRALRLIVWPSLRDQMQGVAEPRRQVAPIDTLNGLDGLDPRARSLRGAAPQLELIAAPHDNPGDRHGLRFLGTERRAKARAGIGFRLAGV